MPKHKSKSPNGLTKKSKCSRTFVLNPGLSQNASKYEGIFKEKKNYKDEFVSVKSSPFPTCQLFDLTEDTFLEELKEELHGLELHEKDNDLYRFHQSSELKAVSLPYLQEFKTTLMEKVKPLVSKMTGIELDDRLALFHARYSRGDYLLCHDDELEGRRVAFILYLVPADWGHADGGALQLFSTDADGNPGKVVDSIYPVNNSFVYFEVSPVSFHQVAEILSDKTRLSLGGWFHGTTVARPEKPLRLPDTGSSYIDISEDIFMSVVNPMYLNLYTQSQIQERFEETSEIKLPDFFLLDKFQSICDKLKSMEDWKVEGPPIRRRVESKHDGFEESACVKDAFDVMRSDAMCLLLSNLTGLRLHPLAPKDEDESEEESSDATPNPRCKGSIRRWAQGNYTLVCDDDLGQAQFALDARICFNVHNWEEVIGGQTVYIARNEDDVLIKCEPENNNLNLVYRDKESLKFVKYVNSMISTNSAPFHDFEFTYFE
eukprot:TRINITY_DN863_c0_g1_i7.p1 TRINITY_DN863_c0_g1~~TRINITY_DN863_c0_g1_i7.p1  ORF type:complete len:488 (-),score=135.69 TRINITY_DN863_c0_g1_i7:92-1555(-)